jgi:hypothetical protein
MAKRALHPKMAAHAQAVKRAHAHLSTNQPGFKQLPPRERFKAVQDHVRRGRSR